MTFDPAQAVETTFLPLVDPERRAADPIRALEAAQDLRILLGLGESGAVMRARDQGISWQMIGQALGMSKQAAQQRFGLFVDLSTGAKVETVEPGPRPRKSPAKGGKQQPKRSRR